MKFILKHKRTGRYWDGKGFNVQFLGYAVPVDGSTAEDVEQAASRIWGGGITALPFEKEQKPAVSEPRYVVTHQIRQHFAADQPPDGMDRVSLETREGLAMCRACKWIVIIAVHELGAPVTNWQALI